MYICGMPSLAENRCIPTAGVGETATVGVNVGEMATSIVDVEIAVGGIDVGMDVDVGSIVVVGAIAGAQALKRSKASTANFFIVSNYMPLRYLRMICGGHTI
jgi:hypothetical protein